MTGGASAGVAGLLFRPRFAGVAVPSSAWVDGGVRVAFCEVAGACVGVEVVAVFIASLYLIWSGAGTDPSIG